MCRVNIYLCVVAAGLFLFASMPAVGSEAASDLAPTKAPSGVKGLLKRVSSDLHQRTEDLQCRLDRVYDDLNGRVMCTLDGLKDSLDKTSRCLHRSVRRAGDNLSQFMDDVGQFTGEVAEVAGEAAVVGGVVFLYMMADGHCYPCWPCYVDW